MPLTCSVAETLHASRGGSIVYLVVHVGGPNKQETYSSCIFRTEYIISYAVLNPVVMLDQNDVHGNQLNGVLTISPTINLGLPEAIVTWSRNGQALDLSDPRISISSGGILTVNDVRVSDRGVYTVTVTNIAAPDGVMDSVLVSVDCKQLN